jgi:hypothetical protein
MVKRNTLIPENLRHAADGAETWGEYVQNQAENTGVSFDEAWMMFEMLGESEAFDGFVTTLEDSGCYVDF